MCERAGVCEGVCECEGVCKGAGVCEGVCECEGVCKGGFVPTSSSRGLEVLGHPVVEGKREVVAPTSAPMLQMVAIYLGGRRVTMTQEEREGRGRRKILRESRMDRGGGKLVQ